MAVRLGQLPLPWLPEGAIEIVPGIGVVPGGDGGGTAWVHGMATYAWGAGDWACRKLAAVQLAELTGADKKDIAAAFGTDAATFWRWRKAYAGQGLAGLLPGKRGPKGPSKLTPQVTARIRELAAGGLPQAEIARQCGVSEFAVRSALGRVGIRQAAGQPDGGEDAGASSAWAQDMLPGETEGLPVLPDPVPRDGERVLARFGLLGEGAVPVFTPGAKIPLAGLLLALPALAGAGLLESARAVYGRREAGSATTEPSTAPGCIPSQRASTSTWSGGPCRSTSDCAAGPSGPGPGWMLSVSASPGSSSTGTSSRAPKIGLWEPGEGRPSRRVLREPGGAIPPGHSPGPGRGRRAAGPHAGGWSSTGHPWRWCTAGAGEPLTCKKALKASRSVWGSRPALAPVPGSRGSLGRERGYPMSTKSTTMPCPWRSTAASSRPRSSAHMPRPTERAHGSSRVTRAACSPGTRPSRRWSSRSGSPPVTAMRTRSCSAGVRSWACDGPAHQDHDGAPGGGRGGRPRRSSPTSTPTNWCARTVSRA